MINIISCFWNAECFIEECVNSVKRQSVNDFKMYLIDDLSTDNTVDKIQSLIANDARFTLIVNKEKKFKIRNMDDILRNKNIICDEDIIIELDGDDALYGNHVLEKIQLEYSINPTLWLTNGNFIYKNGRKGFCAEVNPKTVRGDNFTFCHLKTWKAHLWRKIQPKDFFHSWGNPIIVAPDLAYCYPMIEMAANGHYKFISDILYLYNDESPFNEFKDGSAGGGRFYQMQSEMEIRSKTPYSPL